MVYSGISHGVWWEVVLAQTRVDSRFCCSRKIRLRVAQISLAYAQAGAEPNNRGKEDEEGN